MSRILLATLAAAILSIHWIAPNIFTSAAAAEAIGGPILAAGARQTCAIAEEGSTQCWGRAAMGRGAYPLAASPAYRNKRFAFLGRGTHQGWGVTTEGRAFCWGENDAEQCPAERPGPFSAISGGDKHGCGLLTDGRLDCWGSGEHFDYGKIPGGPYTAIASGYFHTCTLNTQGRVQCWGCRQGGQRRAVDAGQCDPGAVADVRFKAIDSGRQHSCGLTGAGAVMCWGSNRFDQAPARRIGPYSALTTGSFHTCAIRKSDSGIDCWGRNHHGQTGAPPGRFRAIAAGFTFTCAIKMDGGAQCWGEDAETFTEPPPGLRTRGG
jgi:alpha-tubulin suppressor-like RCC1 family protein